eukprot:9504160-Pyramimonas_sp.AAC.1
MSMFIKIFTRGKRLRNSNADPKKVCYEPRKNQFVASSWEDDEVPEWVPTASMNQRGIEIGTLETFSRCETAHDFSTSLQNEARPMHKRELVPSGTGSTVTEEEGPEALLRSQIKQELASLEKKSNPTMYADVVRREIRLFRAVNGIYNLQSTSYNNLQSTSSTGFEGKAFPELFPLGQGFFDAERARPLRFKDYRRRLLLQCDGQFFRSVKWCSWSAMTEEHIEQALINELATERKRHLQASVNYTHAKVNSRRRYFVKLGDYYPQRIMSF